MFASDASDRRPTAVHAHARAATSLVDGLRGENLSEVGDVRLVDGFTALQRAMHDLELERLRRLAEIERRGIYARDGHLSAASWIASRFRVTWSEAKRDAAVARSLDDMPSTRRALEDGEVSMSAARVLTRIRQVDPVAFRDDEAQLVEAARIHSMGDLHRVAAYWRQQVERDRLTDGEEAVRTRRALRASVTFMGMVRLDGDLDPETGETVLTALRAVLDADARNRDDTDRRTPAQRRVDALGEVCRGWLDVADRPVIGGERPHVSVLVGLDALTDGRSARSARRVRGTPGTVGVMSELGHVGPVPPDLTRRLACDASVLRVVMAGASEPLDVGRRTSIVSPALRRAVVARDRHCRFPGCDRPPAWCDAHHVRHWADGGPTAIANLLLLCRRHHRLVHARRGFTVEMIDGRPTFRRPDGSTLTEPASLAQGP
ncbi:MAG TPA: DUF222 domain-containing protein [Actinomycetota bacterium]|nr:DUF222 domain-containing protein [Actinomycetota bacterium]